MFSAGGFGEVPDQFKGFLRTRASSLMLFQKSPLHYRSIQIDGDRDETPAMALGTAIHMAVLEPIKFDATYACDEPERPDDLVTADHLKAELKKHGLKVTGNKPELIQRLLDHDQQLDSKIYDYRKAMSVGSKQVLSERDWKACQRINERIADDAKIKWTLSGGHEELKGWVFHEPTQIVMTFGTDYYKKMPPNSGLGFSALVVDVKKMRDVTPHAFQNTMGKMRMHIQAVAYMEAISAVTQEKCGFGWLAIDDKAPYQIAGYLADAGTVDKGREELLQALAGIRACTDSGKWPALASGWQSASLPHWYIQREDEPVEWGIAE